MPIYVELRDREGRPVRRLPDPSGGTFDAAGDFDRFIDTSHFGYPDEVSLPCLQSVDPYADTEIASEEMPHLVRDLLLSIPLATDGPEKRGLLRLKVMPSTVQVARGLRSYGEAIDLRAWQDPTRCASSNGAPATKWMAQDIGKARTHPLVRALVISRPSHGPPPVPGVSNDQKSRGAPMSRVQPLESESSGSSTRRGRRHGRAPVDPLFRNPNGTSVRR